LVDAAGLKTEDKVLQKCKIVSIITPTDVQFAMRRVLSFDIVYTLLRLLYQGWKNKKKGFGYFVFVFIKSIWYVRKFNTALWLVFTTFLKQNKGLSSFTLERFPCINKNFWWFRFF